mmetsp:Transcript_33421/g.52255  ORF Transcript_33421/g.52255 Transcript_33421/m.52255 type:complete len:158 (-) Transcript_33421:8-481(-)
MSSIYLSSQQGDVHRISAFLASSNSINDPNPANGMSILHYACFGNQLTILQLLCKDPRLHLNLQDSEGWTALHFAADRGLTEITSFLIAQGADGSVQDKLKKTPLHYSAANGHLKVTQMLLDSFPYTAHVESISGKTPYDLAMLRGQDCITEAFASA